MFSVAAAAVTRRLLPRAANAVVLCPGYSRGAHDVAEYFTFKRAIVGSPRTVNESFASSSIRIDQPSEPIDCAKARKQHATYVNELRKLIPEVVELPADERFPDLVYVEEPAVILDGTAVLTQMKPVSRAGEIEPMRGVLEKMGFCNIVQMKDPGAYLDGGDVLFTGREFLVGLTERTNKVSYSIDTMYVYDLVLN